MQSSVIFLKQVDECSIEYASPNEPQINETRLVHFLNLDTPFSDDLFEKWAAVDPNFKKKCNGKKGLRLLRQDAVETIFSFICSSNNNISRIAKMVNTLASAYGTEVWTCPQRGTAYHAFPTAAQLAAHGEQLVDELRRHGFGYRAKFVFNAACAMAADWGDGITQSLRRLPYGALLERLTALPGVGRKVADCICLMACDKFDVVPVDVHVFRIGKRDYALEPAARSLTPQTYARIAAFFTQRFGSHAGWAQLLLFAADLRKATAQKTQK